LKDAEISLEDSRQNYEKAQNLYASGYISRKDLDMSGDNYQRALANYREIHNLLMR
jgi:multidrug resistance efflux pump